MLCTNCDRVNLSIALMRRGSMAGGAQLISDLEGKSGRWFNDLDEGNRVIKHRHETHFRRWNAFESFDPVIFEDYFSTFHVTHFEPAEGGFDSAIALKKPAERLIHFHQMHGTDASIERY